LKKRNQILFSVLILLFFAEKSSAQLTSQAVTTSSSYSYFGLGESIYNGTAENMGKGGLGVAVVSLLSPTFNNPATFYHSKLTTFQVGVKLSEKQQITSTKKNWSNNGALNYAQISFPIKKWWGSGIGILPTYGQGYEIEKENIPTSFGEVNYSFNGIGSMNKLVWSNGINPFKWFSDSLAENFSLGLGVSYVFGNNTKFNRIIYTDFANNGFYNQIVTENNVYDGFQFNTGFLHSFRLFNNNYLSIGGSYDFSSSINSQNVKQTFNYTRSNFAADSIFIKSSDIKIALPSKMSFGLTYTIKYNWQIGVEFKKANWSQFKFGDDTNILINSNTYIFGAEYNSHSSNNNFFKNISYRVGARYVQNPFSVMGNKIDERAVSIGFGLPIKRSFSTINLGLEMMQRGTKKDNLVLENYFSVFIALTINDRWFLKQKYD